MCTVTFIPTSNNFILTSSRDEVPSRASIFPINNHVNGANLLYPMDPKAKGSWLVTSDKGRTACLLNGAFEKHQHTGDYRLSRGIVVLDFFKFDSLREFNDTYLLEGVEPFTLVVVEKSPSLQLFEFRWDGVKKYYKEMSVKESHIWSSSTLYNKEVRDSRENWFKLWLENTSVLSGKEVFNFHKTGGEGSEEDTIFMKRPSGVETISITQVRGEVENLSLTHTGYPSKDKLEASMKIKKLENV